MNCPTEICFFASISACIPLPNPASLLLRISTRIHIQACVMHLSIQCPSKILFDVTVCLILNCCLLTFSLGLRNFAITFICCLFSAPCRILYFQQSVEQCLLQHSVEYCLFQPSAKYCIFQNLQNTVFFSTLQNTVSFCTL